MFFFNIVKENPMWKPETTEARTEIPMAGLACFSTPGKPRAHPISQAVGLTCDDFDGRNLTLLGFCRTI